MWNSAIFVFAFTVVITSVLLLAGVGAETSNDIRKKILKDYDKTLPPILYATSVHYTYIGFSLLRIRDLDESKGELILEGAMNLVWTDERLFWEKEVLLYVKVTSKDIWLPSLRILNSLEPDEVTIDTLPIIFQGGVVSWAQRYVTRTACSLNLKYYPFDKQMCDVDFVPISQEGDTLMVNYTNLNSMHYMAMSTRFVTENIQWDLVTVENLNKKMLIDTETEAEIGSFRLTIQRHMRLIPLGILTPSVASVLLLLATFWMKCGSTVRTGLTVTSLIVSAGSLLSLARILPVSGATTPIIVEYVAITMMLSAISAVHGIIVSILSRCEIPPPISYATIVLKIPEWARKPLGISSDPQLVNMDEAFLFSEVSEHDVKMSNTTEEVETNDLTLPTEQTSQSECLWYNHILLLDRIAFYLLGLVICLFVLSVMVTE